MAYVQLTRPIGDLNMLPAKPYDGTLESIQGVVRLMDAAVQELYGLVAVLGGTSALVTNTPGAGSITGFAPTGFGVTTGRLDVSANAANTTLNDLTAGYDGQQVRVRNTGSTGTLTLTKENAGSTAANRFTGAGNVGIVPGGYANIVYYAGSVNRWVM